MSKDTKPCIFCGKPAMRRRLSDKAWERTKYCSRKCSSEHHRRTKYVVTDNGCWQWQGPYNPTHGYGITRIDKKLMHAHRWMWMQHRGEIPESLELHHRCGNRGCVNPEHLMLLDKAEHAKLHHSGSVHRNNRCMRGHEFTEANTRRAKDGARTCRQCRKITAHLYYERTK